MSEVKAVYAWQGMEKECVKVGLKPYLDRGKFKIKDRTDKTISEFETLEDLGLFISGYAFGFVSGREMKS